MGRLTQSINFGQIDPREGLKYFDTFNKNLHENDFNLRTKNSRLPALRNSIQEWFKMILWLL